MPNMKVTQKDNEILKKTNNKIIRKNNRLQSYNVNKSMNLKTMNDFKSRSEFNNYIEKANKFVTSDANKYHRNKYGVVTNQATLNEIKKELQKVNNQRKEKWNEIKNLAFKSRGEETGTNIRQRQLMGDDRFNVYKPLKFNFQSVRNEKDLQERLESLKYKQTKEYYDKRQQTLKENLIKAIDENWGENGKDAKEYIENLTPEEVEKNFISEDVFHFDYIYNEKKLKSQINRFNRTFGLKEI